MAAEERAHPDGRDGSHGWPRPGEHAFELGTDGPKVLVVGVDGSDTSVHAASYAVGLARRQNSRLVFVYVQSLGGPFGVSATSAAMMATTHEEVAGELACRIRSFMSETGKRDWEFRTVRGDIFGELARVADEVKADGVLVGASMQAGHRIAGSIAVRLVRAGRWPVTVVP
jgi:nucleotide-binding universal stress UspA family protein